MVCGLLLQTHESSELPACHACSESEHSNALLWLLGKHSWSCVIRREQGFMLLAVQFPRGFLCPFPSYPPGGEGQSSLLQLESNCTAHSRWRLLEAHSGSTPLHVSGQLLENAVGENSRQVYSWHP